MITENKLAADPTDTARALEAKPPDVGAGDVGASVATDDCDADGEI